MKYLVRILSIIGVFSILQSINSRSKRRVSHWVGAVFLMFAGTVYADPVVELGILNATDSNGNIVLAAGTDVEVGFNVSLDTLDVLSNRDRIELVQVNGGIVATWKARGPAISGSISLKVPVNTIGSLYVRYLRIDTGEIIASAPETPATLVSVAEANLQELSARVATLEVATLEDRDIDPANEAQTLSTDGNSLTLSTINGVGGGVIPLPQGAKGDKGDQGLPGLAGAKGDKGDQGLPGAKGDPGAPGAKGDPGPAGADGLDGLDGLDGFITYQIGDVGPAGGWVFYVTTDGLHGLEAAPTDQAIPGEGPAEGVPWGCHGVDMRASTSMLDVFYSGRANSNAMNLKCEFLPTMPASFYATSYVSPSGYFDWFLPALGTLDMMMEHIGPRPSNPLGNVGGFKLGGYWSSQSVILIPFGDQDPEQAYFVYSFINETANSNALPKSSKLGVRAVREF